MSNYLRKKERPRAGAYVYTESGTFVPEMNQSKTRSYARVIPDDVEPLLREAYRLIGESRFRRPGSVKTMQAKSRGGSKCYKAQWLSERREFSKDRCLLFPGFVQGRRTKVRYNYRIMSASEAMLIMTKGLPPDEGYQAAHKCGHGHLSCVNPEHLYWATPEQNARDRVIHNPSNLNWVDGVAESDIKEDGRIANVIAWEMGIPVAQVRAIRGY